MAAPDGDLLLQFDHSPRAIVAAITNLRRRRQEVLSSLDRDGRWVIAGLIATGLLVVILDLWLGYRSHLYALVGLGITLGGLWAWRRYARVSKQPSFDRAELQTAEQVIHTLRDDIAPKRNMFGSVDLRGVDDSKRVRHTKDGRGRKVSYFRDGWFEVKAKLYDGSMLRFKVVKHLKRRDGYYKRSRSGKRKWKPPKLKSAVQHLDVRVSPNPQLYALSPASAPAAGQKVGHCTIVDVTLEGGLVRLSATKGTPPTAEELLEILRLAYGTLQAKAVA
jgi:hypothetical protein